ncbi:Uncharacterised protein [Budvicia aquatica]|uniref:Uncharacterized protein n=2 Tax=Budvicia aquatica TaxID=82979 RepID=A0A2C6DJ08_9GAMM|nr:hypothetical protein CRN84_07560 [Budvicia aquatica]VFS47382.1 Uncharacterised protein [Budvicia aquatica]
MMQEILVALAEQSALKYSTVKDEVDIRGDISDRTLRQIAPTTNDIAVALVARRGRQNTVITTPIH